MQSLCARDNSLYYTLHSGPSTRQTHTIQSHKCAQISSLFVISQVRTRAPQTMEIVVDTNDLLSLVFTKLHVNAAPLFATFMCECAHEKRDEKKRRKEETHFKWILKMPIKTHPKSECSTGLGRRELCQPNDQPLDHSVSCEREVSVCVCGAEAAENKNSFDWILYLREHTQSPYFASPLCCRRLSCAQNAWCDGMRGLETGQSTERRSTCNMPYLCAAFLSP